jgi:hypothetical protein
MAAIKKYEYANAINLVSNTFNACGKSIQRQLVLKWTMRVGMVDAGETHDDARRLGPDDMAGHRGWCQAIGAALVRSCLSLMAARSLPC